MADLILFASCLVFGISVTNLLIVLANELKRTTSRMLRWCAATSW
jgi:hypothetical protein